MLGDFEQIARNLLCLEVNTMISQGMTAEKMPNAGAALIQVAQDYQGFLRRCVEQVRDLGQDVPDLPRVATDSGTVEFADWTVRSGGSRTFALLGQASRACQQARRRVGLSSYAQLSEHDTILSRIVANCGQIEGIFLSLRQGDVAVNPATVTLAEESGMPDPPFSRDALVTLRKIWELGTSTVVMQTVVQIDGDVMSRVLDGWDKADSQTVHDIHRQAVDVSLQRWSFLVQTARDLLGFFLGADPRPDSVAAAPLSPPARQLGGPA